MEGAIDAAASWLDTVGIGGWARGSADAYPIANVLHLLGLVMVLGGIGVVDLRIAGAWRALPVEPLARALTPVAVMGLALMLASGTVLFAADGAALARSGMFQTKLLLIATAVANALLFRWRWRTLSTGEPPVAARVLALLSIGLWLSVGFAGRMIAYS